MVRSHESHAWCIITAFIIIKLCRDLVEIRVLRYKVKNIPHKSRTFWKILSVNDDIFLEIYKVFLKKKKSR